MGECMLLKSIRLLCVLLLCVALVYAPEIFTGVSTPYAQKLPERVLLRIALCTEDAQSAQAFYAALNGFRKTAPGVHLRVLRVDEARLCSLSEPLPDVYVFSQDASLDSALLSSFMSSQDNQSAPGSLFSFNPAQGERLLCGVRSDAYARETAVAFVSYLYAGTSDAPPPSH